MKNALLGGGCSSIAEAKKKGEGRQKRSHAAIATTYLLRSQNSEVLWARGGQRERASGASTLSGRRPRRIVANHWGSVAARSSPAVPSWHAVWARRTKRHD